MNSSLGDLDATGKYYGYNNTNHSYEYTEETTSFDFRWIILVGISFITCCTGLLGNGYIIWLLGFQIKRNPFTTFVLNLAVADFGFLIFFVTEWVSHFTKSIIFNFICVCFCHIMYSNSHFLLTVISIDRCVSVLFPIWHRCARPKHLSSRVCVLLWIFSSLLGGILNIMQLTEYFGGLFSLQCLVTAVVSFPLITLSTVVLFIKVCLKVKHKKQGRLLLMILITLLCFLLLAFPLNVFLVIFYFFSINIDSKVPYLGSCIILCSCLNSSINPVIYFLVGRKNQAQSKQSLKVIFQKVFKEGEATGGR